MTPPTDFRSLCAELADVYLRLLEHVNNDTFLGYEPSDDPLLKRARSAQAVPQQGAPSDEKLLELLKGPCDEQLLKDCPDELVSWARSLITRFAAQAAPVAVAERPWARDGWLDGDGQCWLWRWRSCEGNTPRRTPTPPRPAHGTGPRCQGRAVKLKPLLPHHVLALICMPVLPLLLVIQERNDRKLSRTARKGQ